jgi:putative sterol carrier protein
MPSEPEALAAIIAGLAAAVGHDCGLGKTVKFAISGAGPAFIDATIVPNTVTESDAPADCTLAISLENFRKLVEGKANPAMLFMTGKLKVSGDTTIAMKLAPLLKR